MITAAPDEHPPQLGEDLPKLQPTARLEPFGLSEVEMIGLRHIDVITMCGALGGLWHVPLDRSGAGLDSVIEFVERTRAE